MALTQAEKDRRRVEKERTEAKSQGNVRMPQNLYVRPIKLPPMERIKSDLHDDDGNGAAA